MRIIFYILAGKTENVSHMHTAGEQQRQHRTFYMWKSSPYRRRRRCACVRKTIYMFSWCAHLRKPIHKSSTFRNVSLYYIFCAYHTHTHMVMCIELYCGPLTKNKFPPRRGANAHFHDFMRKKHLVKVKHLPLLNRPIYMLVCGACVCVFVGIYICVCVLWCSVTRAHATPTMPRVCCANKFFLGCLFSVVFFFYHRCGATFLFIKLYN